MGRDEKSAGNASAVLRNTNIRAKLELPTPEDIKAKLQLTSDIKELVLDTRKTVSDIIHGVDSRYLVVVGPCSIHDPDAALDYAERLKKVIEQTSETLCIVMRAYFEKPRTSVGWKGFINDPHLDDSFEIAEGLYRARKLLLEINELGVPVGTEALDPITPQYLDDLISWYAIGARTVESQTHREMASGLSAPVGIKNGTDGNLEVMKNALLAVSNPHHFLGISENGRCTVYETRGNSAAHGILRGGKTPNFDPESMLEAEQCLSQVDVSSRLLVDCSHGNSNKQPEKQPEVIQSLLDQIENGDKNIAGFMIESNIYGGNQPLPEDLSTLKYGVSITDGCLGWEESEQLLYNIQECLRGTTQK